MKILAITNQKGGVGKTTTCVNLAASLATFGSRVLLIDLDPQGNATTGSGIDKAQMKHTIYHVLIGEKTVAEVTQKTEKSNFDVLPANRDLAGAEVELVNEIGRETKLKVALAAIKGQYDYVLLDCPPALNLVTVNALTAAHAVMIPMQCEYYALEGLSDLVNTIKKVRTHLNPTLEIEGLLRTMFDNRNMLAQQAQHMGRTLAVPGQHDRQFRIGPGDEYGKGLFDIVIGRVDRLASLGLAGQEGAKRRLAIARRPDLCRLVERAGHAAQEQPGTVLRFRIVQPGVPLCLGEIAGRMDEKHRIGRGRRLRHPGGGGHILAIGRLPACRIAFHAGMRKPHGRVVIGVGRQRLGRDERATRNKRHFGQLGRPDAQSEHRGDHQHDAGGDEV